MNNCGANYAKLFGQPISPPVRIQDSVCLRVSHVVAGANDRRLYSQANLLQLNDSRPILDRVEHVRNLL